VRPHDLYQTLPKTTTLRLGLSPIMRASETVTVRLDAGFDVDVDGGFEDDLTPAVHLDAGVAFQVSDVTSFAFEIATQTVIVTDETETNTVGALSLRFDADRALPYLAAVVPFDDQSSSLVDIALAVGVDVRL
jgi:hypothetical protein